MTYSFYNTPIRRTASGSWIDSCTNQTLNLDGMWHEGQPNGKDIEECVSYTAEGLFVDMRCEKLSECFVCLWRKQPIFTLRGLCSETKIDRDYVLQPNTTYDGHLFFFGFYKNNILFNQEMYSRQIVEDKKEDLFTSSGTMRPTSIVGHLEYDQSENQIPIGLHLWNITDCKEKTYGKLTSVRHFGCKIDSESEMPYVPNSYFLVQI